MTPDVRLERMESRQEDLIRAVDKLAEVIGILSGQMAEMVEWAQTPPSTNLGETMREVALGIRNVHGTVLHLGTEVRVLPERTARLVTEEFASRV